MSSTLKWIRPLKSLVQQASKGMIMLKSLKSKCGDIPIEICLDIFNKSVAPILLYGCELWGYTYRTEIEQFQAKVLKIVLNVPKNAPHCAVLGECGQKPLSVLYMTRCIKFWLRLVQTDEHRYNHSCYQRLFQLCNNGKETWAYHIKELLFKYGFGHVWVCQGVGNPELFVYEFKQRVADITIQEWNAMLTGTSKLSSYCTYKSLLEPELYLSSVRVAKHRTALTKLRCSTHHLAVEKLRGLVVRENRLCKYCLLNSKEIIEDESHFVNLCPLYDDIRLRFLHCCKIDGQFAFRNLMSTKNSDVQQRLAAFVFYAFKRHDMYYNSITAV